jgi:hypothetical protein
MSSASITVTIPAGQSESNTVQLPGPLTGIGIPGNWSSASLTFQGAGGNAPLGNVQRNNIEYELNAQPSIYLAEDVNYWKGISSIALRSGTAETPVDQTQSVILTITYEVPSC